MCRVYPTNPLLRELTRTNSCEKRWVWNEDGFNVVIRGDSVPGFLAADLTLVNDRKRPPADSQPSAPPRLKSRGGKPDGNEIGRYGDGDRIHMSIRFS